MKEPKIINFRDRFEIEIGDDSVYFREWGEIPYNHDDSFIVFTKEEIKRLIKILQEEV